MIPNLEYLTVKWGRKDFLFARLFAFIFGKGSSTQQTSAHVSLDRSELPTHFQMNHCLKANLTYLLGVRLGLDLSFLSSRYLSLFPEQIGVGVMGWEEWMLKGEIAQYYLSFRKHSPVSGMLLSSFSLFHLTLYIRLTW